MPVRRVTISEDCYKALQAEGLVSGKSPAAVLGRCILNGVSQKAREVLSTIGETSATEKRKIGLSDSKARAPKRQLAKNPEALERVKELWRGGERNQQTIAEAVGYARSTVGGQIRRLLEEGELAGEGGEESTN